MTSSTSVTPNHGGVNWSTAINERVDVTMCEALLNYEQTFEIRIFSIFFLSFIFGIDLRLLNEIVAFILIFKIDFIRYLFNSEIFLSNNDLHFNITLH